MKLFKLYLREDISIELKDLPLDNIRWRVYRFREWSNSILGSGLAPEFIKRLSSVNTLRDFQRLPYEYQALRDNFWFLVNRYKEEVEPYMALTLKEFVLGTYIDPLTIKKVQDFHTDDEFGYDDNSIFIWFGEDGQFRQGQPWHMSKVLGPVSSNLQGLLDTVKKVVKDFITKKFIS